MNDDSVVRALGAVIDLVAYLPAEAGRPAAVALRLAQDLIAAGHGDPEGMLQALREQMKDDWRSALAGKFTG